MGYHVAILRTNEKQLVPITLQEVADIAARVPGWSYDAGQQALLATDNGDDSLALWLSDGELWTSNPDAESLRKMLALAERLGGRVRGDELETYRSPDEAYLHPDDAEAKAQEQEEVSAIMRRTRRNQFILNAALLGSFLLLIFTFKYLGLLE